MREGLLVLTIQPVQIKGMETEEEMGKDIIPGVELGIRVMLGCSYRYRPGNKPAIVSGDLRSLNE